jgi:hypothetical protein
MSVQTSSSASFSSIKTDSGLGCGGWFLMHTSGLAPAIGSICSTTRATATSFPKGRRRRRYRSAISSRRSRRPQSPVIS